MTLLCKEGIERDELYGFAAEVFKKEGSKEVGDIASALGYGSAILAEKHPNGMITAVDLDPEFVAMFAKRYNHKNLKAFQGDIRDLKFPDATFDAVASFHTIEHVNAEDQVKLMKELARVIKPGGLLVTATPDLDVMKLQGTAGLQADHVKEINQQEFIDIVSNGSFKVEGLYGQGFLMDNPPLSRRMLVLLKKLDVLRLRRFVKSFVDTIDTKTQPISLDFSVKPMIAGKQKASTTVLVCRRV